MPVLHQQLSTLVCRNALPQPYEWSCDSAFSSLSNNDRTGAGTACSMWPVRRLIPQLFFRPFATGIKFNSTSRSNKHLTNKSKSTPNFLLESPSSIPYYFVIRTAPRSRPARRSRGPRHGQSRNPQSPSLPLRALPHCQLSILNYPLPAPPPGAMGHSGDTWGFSSHAIFIY
jgi:hypothetical protein